MKTEKCFKLRPDGSMVTPEFRVSFPKVFTASEEGKYGLAMIFDRDTDFSILEKAIARLTKEKYPTGAPKGFKNPILDGDEGDREEQKDKFYINGKCGKYGPGLVDQNKVEIVDESEFYPGCWARAAITLYAWTFKGKAGVSVNVRNIQKLRDDEPLVSRTNAADEFDAVCDPATDDL